MVVAGMIAVVFWERGRGGGDLGAAEGGVHDGIADEDAGVGRVQDGLEGLEDLDAVVF